MSLKQFNGFINTPKLWLNVNPFSIVQLDIPLTHIQETPIIQKKVRLGKLIEHFVIHSLKQDNTVEILAEGLQIQKDKNTIGELDCLYTKDGKPYHLEIVYKFYLYDESHGASEIEKWVGPNRNDTLVQKVDKLQTKQFPLLYNTNTKPYLKALGYKPQDFEQQLCFKAQLFLPYNKEDIKFERLNPNCINGFYINVNQLDYLEDSYFYIPTKLDWLVNIHENAEWIDFSIFLNKITPLLSHKKSPLCWVKKPDGKLFKCFITWW